MARVGTQPGIPDDAPRREPEWFADRERRNPYFRWVMRTGVPLVASLLVHGSIFLFLAIQSWGLLNRPTPVEDFNARVVSAGDVASGFKWPGEADLAMTAPDPAPIIEPAKFADPTTLSELAKLANPSGDADAGGFGIGDSGRSGILGIGSGAGEGGGAGLGAGFSAGTGLGEARVWSVGAAGRDFVYVVDFSGSIIVAVEDLKRELKRSIGALQPKQNFDVIIFYSEAEHAKDKFVTESFEPGLVPGDPETKRKVFAWLDRKAPKGQTDPVPAMKRALALKPDAIFLFSDGAFEGDKVVDEITKANEGRKTTIHCLVFDEILLQETGRNPRLTKGAERMQKLAGKNGGKCKVVTGADLERK